MAREYLRQATPAEVEELKKQKQAYCKENPDTDGCEEEVNTDAMVEVGQMDSGNVRFVIFFMFMFLWL